MCVKDSTKTKDNVSFPGGGGIWQNVKRRFTSFSVTPVFTIGVLGYSLLLYNIVNRAINL